MATAKCLKITGGYMERDNKMISVVANSETSIVERILGCISAQGVEFGNVIANITDDSKTVVNVVLNCGSDKLTNVLKRLDKLVPVYSAVELTQDNSLTQQLALIKFNAKKISNDLLSSINSNSNISIILPLGAENNRNNTDGVSILGKDNDYIVVKIAESGNFIDAFVSKYKNAIVDIVRTGDLAIAIK